MARRESHGLGMGSGSIIDYGDGIIEYRQTGKLLPAFKVNIADVTGFSLRSPTREDRKNGASRLQQVLVLQGSGTTLASCAVNHGTGDKIEAWFRAHELYRGNIPQSGLDSSSRTAATDNLADQLSKLAHLRDSGALTPEEFDAAKAKLLK